MSEPAESTTKLIIQIPCYNEEETLEETLNDLPTQINGVDVIETLIVDDGCTDNTLEVAKEWGVNHIERHLHNKGLAVAFKTGIERALQEGADLIVNTDADNQYRGEEIPKLVQPLIEQEAEIVVGERVGAVRESFSWVKERLQRIGSAVVRTLSNTDVPDVTSGFRAYTRDAALHLDVVSSFSYTLETLLQTGNQGIPIVSVPVETNPPRRKSRLFDSIYEYVKHSANTIIRVFILYRPLKFFGTLGAIIFTGGFLIGCRFLYHFMSGDGSGHLQSLILAAVLLIVGFLVGIIGLVADIVSANRKLTQDVLYLERKREYSND